MKKLKASEVIDIDDKFIEAVSERLKNKSEAKEVKKDEVQRVYTVHQVAFKINKKAATVRRHISEGILNATKIGKSWIVTREDLQTYLGVEVTENNNSQWK